MKKNSLSRNRTGSALLLLTLTLTSGSACASLDAASAAQPAAVQSPAALTNASALSVRAMSFNVLWADAISDTKSLTAVKPRSDLAWDSRDDQVAAWVRWNNPDVVGFQENQSLVEQADGTMALQLETIDDELLGDYQWVQLDQGEPIAFKRERFTLRSTGYRRIEFDDGGETSYWDRRVTWAVLKDKSTGQDFIVFNTHLTANVGAKIIDHKLRAALNTDRYRPQQVKNLIAVIKMVDPGMAVPFVVTGDFNTPAGSTGLKGQPEALMKSAGMVDTARAGAVSNAEVPGAASMGLMTGKVGSTYRYRVVRTAGSRLDYVWVPRGTVVSTFKVSAGPHVVKRQISGKYYPWFDSRWVIPSDHLPVVSDVTFPAVAPK